MSGQMGAGRKAVAGLGRIAAGAVLAACCVVGRAAPARVPTGPTDPWQAAVLARARFEALGSHTRAEYSGVIDRFRAIYHTDPADVHAAAAIGQVAELLAEQARELQDDKSLRDAAGQYDFLVKQYPASSLAAPALAAEAALFGPDGLGDAAEARRVIAELKRQYPRSAAARLLVSGPMLAGKPIPETPAVANAAPAVARPKTDTSASPIPSLGREDSSRMVRKSTPGGSEPRNTASAPEGPGASTVAPARVAAPEPAAAGLDDLRVGGGPQKDRDAPSAETVARPIARVTGVRHWSTASYTRVAIDLGDEVQYQAARVEHPDRIFFDLHHARLAQELVGKSFAVTDDGFLLKIRAAQFSDDVTRVVLDVHEVTDYSAFLLPNPYRLIIDIHGKTAAPPPLETGEQSTADAAPWTPSKEEGLSSEQGKKGDPAGVSAPLEASEVPRPPAAKPEAARPEASKPGVDAGVSRLPPMPVTDGSASFGLPPKTSLSAKAEAVAPPRVVIPVKPTAAKPVPNTITSKSATTGSDLAAVSDQPGKVEATRRPTSAPVSDRAADAKVVGSGVAAPPSSAKPRKGRGTEEPAAPVEAAPPTAEGETSLVRALGLKIGRIVIDAGHGGHDSGTLGVDGIQEKDVVLDVALRLGKMLHQRLGAEIVYTRADDTFIPLETRTAIANKAQADLFISVHANSSQDASARGVEVYYLNFTSDPEAMRVAGRENAVSTQSVHELSDLVKKIALKDKIDESRELASDVEGSLYAGLQKGNNGLKNRGVKKAPFVVLIGANMPSILAEISFVTNPDDAAQLRLPEYRQRVAESLFAGVERYAGPINGLKAKTKKPTLQRAAVRR